MAFICHGGWIPISAKILSGKRVTGSRGIKDDLENAGGIWVDEPVVIDGNLISSRTPLDLPAFGLALVQALERVVPPPGPASGSAGRKRSPAPTAAAATDPTGSKLRKVMLRDVLK